METRALSFYPVYSTELKRWGKPTFPFCTSCLVSGFPVMDLFTHQPPILTSLLSYLFLFFLSVCDASPCSCRRSSIHFPNFCPRFLSGFADLSAVALFKKGVRAVQVVGRASTSSFQSFSCPLVTSPPLPPLFPTLDNTPFFRCSMTSAQVSAPNLFHIAQVYM